MNIPTKTPTSVLLLAAMAAATGARADAPDSIDWRTDLEASRKLAANLGKPLLIVFR